MECMRWRTFPDESTSSLHDIESGVDRGRSHGSWSRNRPRSSDAFVRSVLLDQERRDGTGVVHRSLPCRSARRSNLGREQFRKGRNIPVYGPTRGSDVEQETIRDPKNVFTLDPMTEPTPIVHVVDDDDSVRTAVMRLLRAAGYVVRGYSCAGEF